MTIRIIASSGSQNMITSPTGAFRKKVSSTDVGRASPAAAWKNGIKSISTASARRRQPGSPRHSPFWNTWMKPIIHRVRCTTSFPRVSGVSSRVVSSGW